ncbi:MAG TPA: electron transfer flavoprotein subunit alpha/FixB family protein [Gammaproteobacteria bacterium]|nr:electron transfer flavoprotein subunit alpha/FixB family protein [Gammaproteobacteria bacterium]
MSVRVLIVAEHDGARLAEATAKCVACAGGLGAETVDVAVLAERAGPIAEQAARIPGVDRVLAVEDAPNAAPLAAVLAPQIAELAAGYTHVLGPSTTFGKDVMPRVAALLGVGQVSDVSLVEGPYRFKRPIYAGNAIVTVEARADRKLVATVRTASYRPPAGERDAAAPIETRRAEAPSAPHTRFVRLESERSGRPDLQTAARVVAGGRAFGSAEKFALLYELADELGAAVGASRAAVDAGYAANDLQVGQTGKVIAPELYIAIGISGAIQHLTGIKDARVIAAINKDRDAPIFEVADVGLVADLFEALPALVAALKAAR